MILNENTAPPFGGVAGNDGPSPARNNGGGAGGGRNERFRFY